MRYAARPANARVFTRTLTLLIAAGCGSYDSSVTPSPVVTTLTVALAASSIEVGQTTTATAAALDQYGLPVATFTVAWSSSQPEIASVNPTTGVILALAPGTTQISATAEGGRTASQTITVFRAPAIRANEVKSNRGASESFIDPTAAAVDMSGDTDQQG